MVGEAEVIVAAEAGDPPTAEFVADAVTLADRGELPREPLGVQGVEAPAEPLIQLIGHAA